MKILYVTYYFLPHVGAATQTVLVQERMLVESGHTVDILAPRVRHGVTLRDSERSSRLAQYVPSLPLPRVLAPILSVPFLFVSALRRSSSCDLIIAQYHPHHLVFPLSNLVGKISKRPVVGYACDVRREGTRSGRSSGPHSGHLSASVVDSLVSMVNVLNEAAVVHDSKLLVVCTEERNTILSRTRNRGNVRVVPSPIDLNDFRDIPGKSGARQILGIDESAQVLLFAGRYSGQEYMMELAIRAAIDLANLEIKVQLWLVGDVPSQSLVRSATGYIGTTVHFVGVVPRETLRLYIWASDICIGPLGPTLAVPQKVLEYLACLKPVITGKNSISADLYNHRNMVIVQPDSSSIRDTVLSLLADQSALDQLAQEGYESLTPYEISNVMEELNLELNDAMRRKD